MFCVWPFRRSRRLGKCCNVAALARVGGDRHHALRCADKGHTNTDADCLDPVRRGVSSWDLHVLFVLAGCSCIFTRFFQFFRRRRGRLHHSHNIPRAEGFIATGLAQRIGLFSLSRPLPASPPPSLVGALVCTSSIFPWFFAPAERFDANYIR